MSGGNLIEAIFRVFEEVTLRAMPAFCLVTTFSTSVAASSEEKEKRCESCTLHAGQAIQNVAAHPEFRHFAYLDDEGRQVFALSWQASELLGVLPAAVEESLAPLIPKKNG